MQRRLAAIIAADVVGYSRLMSEDENRTLTALTQFRDEVLEPSVRQLGGQIVKRMGDGWFIEFATARDAVKFAIGLQQSLLGHEVIRLRVGVHIGDVTFQDDDIYGGGINIAARLEALAEPGQVMISDTVRNSLDDVSSRLFGGGDEVALKNISRPVRVWRWSPAGTTDAKASAKANPAKTEKPSIAVLPFRNLSSDPEQEFFADGIVEDLIMALSRFPWLFVISRNSCFTYKGKSVQAGQVAEDLGVRYVVEGSVRQSATRIRVSAQLIDAAHDRHVWSEKYDRPIGDLFDIQDEISQAMTGVLVPALGSAERDRSLRSTRPTLDAWEAYQKGLAHYYRPYSHDDHATARRLFDQAIEQDPGFSDALAMIAMMGIYAINSGQSSYTGSRAEIITDAKAAAERAVQADDGNALAHVALGRINDVLGNHDVAIAECQTAVSLNPNLALAHHELGFVLANAGRAGKAIAHHEAAINLSPNDPSRWNFHLFKGTSLFAIGENAQAITCLREAARLRPASFWPYFFMATCYVETGQMSSARDAVRELLQRRPNWTLVKAARALSSAPAEPLARWLNDLRELGLPEE